MAASPEAPGPWYLALVPGPGTWPWYLALVPGPAVFCKTFPHVESPKIRLCVHCLQAVFLFKPPPRVEARTHLQLGSVLYRHTKNRELAQTHLEKAVSSRSHTVGPPALVQ